MTVEGFKNIFHNMNMFYKNKTYRLFYVNDGKLILQGFFTDISTDDDIIDKFVKNLNKDEFISIVPNEYFILKKNILMNDRYDCSEIIPIAARFNDIGFSEIRKIDNDIHFVNIIADSDDNITIMEEYIIRKKWED